MKVVDIKKPKPNEQVLAFLAVIAEKVLNGEIQSVAMAWQGNSGEAGHQFVPVEGDVDHRLLLAELHLCAHDVTLCMLCGDSQTFAGQLLTSDEID